MKKLLILFSFTLSVAYCTQTDISNMANQVVKDQSGNIGNVISEMGKGISPSAFGSKWKGAEKDWFKNTGSIADVAGASSSISKLVKNIKPSAFTSEFAKTKDTWMKNLTGAKSFSDIGGSLGGLVGGLKPESLTKTFNDNKDLFLTGLKMLK